MRVVFVVLTLALVSGCAGTSFMTPSGYLGLPENESHPASDAEPIPIVRDRGYHSVSKVSAVPYKNYLLYKKDKQTKYEFRQDNTIYFSIELNVDFEKNSGLRLWMTILERKKTIVPPGTEQADR